VDISVSLGSPGTLLGESTENETCLSDISSFLNVFPCPNLSATPALTVVLFHVSVERGF
jgi:hypothetical protein